MNKTVIHMEPTQVYGKKIKNELTEWSQLNAIKLDSLRKGAWQRSKGYKKGQNRNGDEEWALGGLERNE